MGTNYYWYDQEVCKVCGRQSEPLHIGKSSAGWYFALHVYPEKDIKTLNDWKKLFSQPSSFIFNEYEDEISIKEITEIITNRKWDYKKCTDDKFLKDNYAEIGINNLLKRIIDGRHCIGHGEGTWDYCIGDFR